MRAIYFDSWERTLIVKCKIDVKCRLKSRNRHFSTHFFLLLLLLLWTKHISTKQQAALLFHFAFSFSSEAIIAFRQKWRASSFNRYVFIRVMSRRKSVTEERPSRSVARAPASNYFSRGTEVGAFASSNLVVIKILRPISGQVSHLSVRSSPSERF